MGVNISKLKRDKVFLNSKIKICFSTGSLSNQLSVYLFGDREEQNHILWEIYPSSHQNFDKSNDRIKLFVESKIHEWQCEDHEEERLRLKSIKEKELREEEYLNNLIKSF